MSGDSKVGIVLTAEQWRTVATYAEDGAAAANRGAWFALGPLLDQLHDAADSVDPQRDPRTRWREWAKNL